MIDIKYKLKNIQYQYMRYTLALKTSNHNNFNTLLISSPWSPFQFSFIKQFKNTKEGTGTKVMRWLDTLFKFKQVGTYDFFLLLVIWLFCRFNIFNLFLHVRKNIAPYGVLSFERDCFNEHYSKSIWPISFCQLD